jgi:hypothetical protein
MKHPGRTRPFRGPEGELLPGSIAEVGYLRLGGLDQWVLIRGESLGNPALIVLPGGPGCGDTPLSRRPTLSWKRASRSPTGTSAARGRLAEARRRCRCPCSSCSVAATVGSHLRPVRPTSTRRERLPRGSGSRRPDTSLSSTNPRIQCGGGGGSPAHSGAMMAGSRNASGAAQALRPPPSAGESLPRRARSSERRTPCPRALPAYRAPAAAKARTNDGALGGSRVRSYLCVESAAAECAWSDSVGALRG